MNPIGLTRTDHERRAFRLMERQTEAMRKMEALHADAELALSGGTVPLEEALSPDVSPEFAAEVADVGRRLRACLTNLKDAEATLADIEANPHPKETPERWRRAHDEVARWRHELRLSQSAADMCRWTMERMVRMKNAREAGT